MNYKYVAKLLNPSTDKILNYIIIADSYNEAVEKTINVELRLGLVSLDVQPVGGGK